jgi:transposase-like protein
MAEPLSPSSSFKDSSPDSPPGTLVAPDANAARDAKGHFTGAFKLAAVRYAAACGKSQRAAAADIGISDGTLADWSRDTRPVPAARDGVVDVERFDELAQLRSQNHELLARNLRLTAERDFLKKCASYFATPINGGSK